MIRVNSLSLRKISLEASAPLANERFLGTSHSEPRTIHRKGKLLTGILPSTCGTFLPSQSHRCTSFATADSFLVTVAAAAATACSSIR